MSKENPTPAELSEIEQFQHGAYGAEPPTWFTDPPTGWYGVSDNATEGKQLILQLANGRILGPYVIENLDRSADEDTVTITATRVRRNHADLDEAMRLYRDGAPFSQITEETGVSTAKLLSTKYRRGIPDRPQRADGTMRRWP